MELSELLERINVLQKEINQLRPINTDTEKKIWQKFRLDWNFHSNNLEGNSLTFGETKSFLLHGITAEGKPLKDHLDIKGHNEAILLLDDIVKQKRPLTETFIREMHQTILHEPYENPAITSDGKRASKRVELGRYKKMPNHVKTVTGEIFYFASVEETPAKMNDLMDWYEKANHEKELHPLIIASEFHYRFVRIHPFDDGNGRMARILMNLILMRYEFPPVIIKTTDKVNYFKNLQLADGGNMNAFYLYIGEQLISSEELFLKGARGEEIQDADDVDKEISLLKARLQNETHKIIYAQDSIVSIVQDSILPLLNLLFSKIDQFDELFNSKNLFVRINRENIVTARNSKTEEFIKQVTALISGNANVVEYLFSINWKDFIKTENKLFSVWLKFHITFNQSDFIIIIDEGKKEQNQSFKVFYHKKNDEKKFQQIASALAKVVLAEISKNLEEE